MLEVAKMSASKGDAATELDRLRRGSSIEIDERREPLWQGAKFSKNGFATIGDIDWQHIDPMQIFEKVSKMDPKVLKHDILFFSGFVIAVTIPFAVPFPELCIEVSQYCKIEERVLCDMRDEVIMDFSPKGVKKAFQ